MILNFIKTIFIVSTLAALSACSSSSSSSSDKSTEVSLSAAPWPSSFIPVPAGPKTFMNNGGDTITITKAYLVISSATIETECDVSFSAAAESLLDFLIPQASAHTESTPTSTGEPIVINLLAADGVEVDLGELSPPTGDYCGVDVDLLAADEDADNLPSGVGEPDMIGKTVYIEGSYSLSTFGSSGGTGAILISTGTTLINRELLLVTDMEISKDEPKGSIEIGINYDTWFNSVALDTLETETSTLDPNMSQLLQNISSSIHQI